MSIRCQIEQLAPLYRAIIGAMYRPNRQSALESDSNRNVCGELRFGAMISTCVYDNDQKRFRD
jgi:hypothetical protein